MTARRGCVVCGRSCPDTDRHPIPVLLDLGQRPAGRRTQPLAVHRCWQALVDVVPLDGWAVLVPVDPPPPDARDGSALAAQTTGPGAVAPLPCVVWRDEPWSCYVMRATPATGLPPVTLLFTDEWRARRPRRRVRS